MDLRAALLQEHSKAQSLKIAAYIGEQSERFEELLHVLVGCEYHISQRAAWVVNICADH